MVEHRFLGFGHLRFALIGIGHGGVAGLLGYPHIVEHELSGAGVARLEPEGKLTATVDGQREGLQLHCIVDLYLLDDTLVGNDIEDEVVIDTFAEVLHHIYIVPVLRFIGNRKGERLILAEGIEGNDRCLSATLLHQRQDRHLACQSAAGRNTCIGAEVRAADSTSGTHEAHHDSIGDGDIFQPERHIGLEHHALVDLRAVLHLEETPLRLAVLETVVEVEVG